MHATTQVTMQATKIVLGQLIIQGTNLTPAATPPTLTPALTAASPMADVLTQIGTKQTIYTLIDEK